jgi:hypothetical protein
MLIFPKATLHGQQSPEVEQLLKSYSRQYRHLATLATVAMGLDTLLATNLQFTAYSRAAIKFVEVATNGI